MIPEIRYHKINLFFIEINSRYNIYFDVNYQNCCFKCTENVKDSLQNYITYDKRVVSFPHYDCYILNRFSLYKFEELQKRLIFIYPTLIDFITIFLLH